MPGVFNLHFLEYVAQTINSEQQTKRRANADEQAIVGARGKLVE